MWLSLCSHIIISIIIIIIIHYLFNYLKDTFTIQKHKDVFHTQIEKYKSIIEEMEYQKTEKNVDEYTEQSNENELMQFANQCLQEQ